MSLHKRLVALFVGVILVMTLPISSAVAVTYGSTVENPSASFPEVVPVWLNEGMCSGTLIEQQVVLTAAHCIYGETGPFQISVGGNDLLTGNRIDVDATWYHPRYDESFAENDVGLLHLVKPAGVRRLGTLPKSMAAKPSTFTLLGWGLDQNRRLTGKLSKLKLTNYESYTKKTYKSSYNTKTMIGAGRYFPSERLYGGSCSGDSGGPLYKGTKSREIVGVTSWGSAKGCTSYRPSVFVRVSYHTKTILSAIKKLKLRSIQSPITTGSPVSGTTAPTTSLAITTTTKPAVVLTTTTTRPPTTTTTAAPVPLTLSYTTRYQNYCFRYSCTNPGMNGTFKASAKIAKWCIQLDGQPLPDFRYVTGKSFGIDYETTPTQSGGAGCYEKPSATSDSVSMSGPSGLDAGIHKIVMTAYDVYGRSVSSLPVSFNGKLMTGESGLWPESVTTNTRTGEIELRFTASMVGPNNAYDAYITKVCHTILRDGVTVTDMKSGYWAVSEPNCVVNPSTSFAASNQSSGVVLDPPGTQNWGVYATIYDSKGKSVTTDSYWFNS
jgi:secreted trypsin-like serine protease